MGDNEALAYLATVTLGYYGVNGKYKDFAYCFNSLKTIKIDNSKHSVKWRRPQDLHIKVVQ